MNIPEQTFDAHFDAGKSETTESEFSIMRIQVFSPVWTMEPKVEFWIYNPQGERIAVFEGNEDFARAALKGIETFKI